jgi:lyso-ornithine lipid O-acyltransferase
MKTVRFYFKLFVFALTLIWHFLILTVLGLFRGKDVEKGFRIRRQFCRSALSIFNIRVQFKGNASKLSGLYISNHRTMLDPLVELSIFDVYILSKAEVGDYPLIGKGAKETGVFFVDRNSDNSRKAALDAIDKLLGSGKPVLIYPEGTTHAAELTSDFRKGAFEVAFRKNIQVVPIMIEYDDESYYWTDEPLMGYFKRIISKQGHHNVYVEMGSPVSATTAEELLLKTKASIDEMIFRHKMKMRPAIA